MPDGTNEPRNAMRLVAQSLEEARGAKRKLYLGAAIIVLLTTAQFLVAGWYGSRQARKASEAAQAAAEAEGRAKILKEEANAADGRARLASAQRDAVAQEVARLRKKLAETPLPEPAKPAPAGDAELSSGLQARGILTPLPRIEAVTVWNWSEEALRVPQLERRGEALEALVKGQDMDITALKGEKQALEEARDRWREANGAQADRSAALERQVVALQKEAKAREVKWWIKIGVGALVSYGVGRATR